MGKLPKLIGISGFAAALGLAGCSSAPPLPPQLPQESLGLPNQFVASGNAHMAQRWWQSFGDSRLDVLVHYALAENPDLQATYWRLAQADAVAAQARSGFWPRLTGRLENTEQKRSSSDGFDFAGGENQGNTWTGNLAASYEVDLWGRVRSGARAAEAGRLAQEMNVQTAALTLAAEVAGVWLQLQEQRGQGHLLSAQLEVNEKTLRALELRFGSGIIAAADVLQQRQLVQQSLQDLAQSRANADLLLTQLAALLGMSADALPPAAFVDAGLPVLPALPDTGFPTALLLRRPDVQRAQREVLQGHYLSAQAWAERLPTLSFDMFFSGGGTSISDIANDWLLNLSLALEGVIFDGGNLAARKREQAAAEQERWALFRNTVMQALSEVEQALINEQAIRTRLSYLETRTQLADQITLRQRRAYGQGSVDFLNVLSSTNNQQLLQREILTARRELLENRVTLYRALSGGLPVEDLPEPLPVELDVYSTQVD
ncbi:efflux transporter outer membrane subunit [Microbulbifer agarilyticus]|uniref:efflux transporter outer membrane subunit n=1 Tax=Microbulbifer agarilyticus TaxID=260552 RepID=UPI001CD80A5C|nr:TolC family protein [Microbulbifer agarilyticus]MCA0891967.1 TolC family protein [Microbulbifer agarilyticus]